MQDNSLSHLESKPVKLVYFEFLEAYFDDGDEEENYSACCRYLRAIQGSAKLKVEPLMCSSTWAWKHGSLQVALCVSNSMQVAVLFVR